MGHSAWGGKELDTLPLLATTQTFSTQTDTVMND